VDQAAHGGALKAQGRTIAVVGCGLLAIPRKMTGGMEKAIAEQGAVMSELGPYSKASIPHIMARNRLISGLSRAVIVVQSRRRGGALVTADYARKQGRLVYAVPWPKGLPQGDGTAQLMRDGAQPISGPGDVAQLATQLGMVPPKAPQQLPLIDDL
jgi:DNA processing protein